VISDEQDDQEAPNPTPHNSQSVTYLPVDDESEYLAPISEDVRGARDVWLGGGQMGINKQY